MSDNKLGDFQAVTIIITVMLAHIMLNLPNHLISETGSATILNFIYIFIIVLFVFLFSVKFFNLFPNNDIIDICEYTAGKKIKNIFTIALCLYLLTISAFVIRIFAESLILIYFPNIDLEIILFVFIIITTLMNLLGFKSISRVTGIILPIILVTLLVIFLLSASNFTYERALPILGYGAFDTFVKGLREYLCF